MFHQLPVELKSTIFSWCLPNEPLDICAPNPLLSFLLVCQSWHSIIIATPRLWASFQAPTFISPGTQSELASLLKVWLARSKKAPLAIQLKDIPPYDRAMKPRPLSPAPLIPALLSHTDRIQHLSLKLHALNSPLEILRHKAFPRLESLDFEYQTSGDHSELKLPQSLAVPWTQLTDLRVLINTGGSPTFDDWAGILACAVALRNCEINASATFNGPLRHSLIRLPALVSLHLNLRPITTSTGSTTETALMAFLQTFRFDVLNTFTLQWLSDMREKNRQLEAWMPVQDQFLDFIRSLSPVLQTLRISYLPLTEEELISILRTIPQLTDLEVKHSLGVPYDVDKVLRALTVGRDCPQMTLLPRLQSLHLQMRGESLSAESLIRMAASRGYGASDTQLSYIGCVMLKREDRFKKVVEGSKLPLQMKFIEVS